jgi:hypothetical protein
VPDKLKRKVEKFIESFWKVRPSSPSVHSVCLSPSSDTVMQWRGVSIY